MVKIFQAPDIQVRSSSVILAPPPPLSHSLLPVPKHVLVSNSTDLLQSYTLSYQTYYRSHLTSVPPSHLSPSSCHHDGFDSTLLKGKQGALPHLSVKPSLEPGILHVFDLPPPTCPCLSLPLYSISMYNYDLWFYRYVGVSQVAQW